MDLLIEIRRTELDLALRWLPSSGRLLELGGGTGWQAHLLSRHGYDVVSLDVRGRPPPVYEYHPIEFFDGRHIPYPGGSFDAIFSSNVLEHVSDLPTLLGETRRVLRPGGVAVHIMPTPVWRFWNALTYYVELVRRGRRYLRRRREASRFAGSDSGGPPSRRRILSRDFLLPGPHGEGRSALEQLFSYRESRWQDVFKRNGFFVTDTCPNRLFYSGHSVLSGLSIRQREHLSRVLGSACRIYVARAAPASNPRSFRVASRQA